MSDEELIKALETRCTKRTGETEMLCTQAAKRLRELIMDFETQRKVIRELRA